MRYYVAIDRHAIDSALQDVESTGMKVSSWSSDYISCEGGFLAGRRLKSLCTERGWRLFETDSRLGCLASSILSTSLVLILLLSLYGSVVVFRCHKDALGQDITVGEITVLAIVVWLGLVVASAVAWNQRND